jgi:hypothetical protein
VGNAGCPLHPQPRVHFVLVERTRATTSTPESPGIPARNGFTAYVGLSPVTGLFCHRHPRKCSLSAPGWADLPSRELDASVGASGPHDFAVREKRLSSACCLSLTSLSTRPAIPSRAKRCRVHRIPCPTSVTIAIRPSCGTGWREFVEMICPTGEAKYFCKQGWTPLSTNRPTGKSPHGIESKFRSCPGWKSIRHSGARHLARARNP